MAQNSTRSKIMDILRDTNVFPVGYTGDIADIKNKVKSELSKRNISTDVEDIDHSIAEAVETISGYKSRTNDTVVQRQRLVTKKITYTFK